MALAVDEDVVGLQVPVDISHLVDALQGQKSFGDIEPCLLLCKNVLLYEKTHKISPGHVFHDQVQIRFVLEGAFELDDPRVGGGVRKNLLLFSGLNHFVLGDHMRLFHPFDGYGLVRLAMPAQSDLPKCTPADGLDALIILEAGLVALLP